MIPLSPLRLPRSLAAGRVACALSPFKAASALLLQTWLVSCLSFLSASCLYLGPITAEVENLPPEILNTTDGEQFCDADTLEEHVGENLLCVVRDEQVVYVTARDPDGDVLEFWWEASATGVFGSAREFYQGDFQSSELTLQRDELVDGEELRCTVTDGEELRSVSWTVVVF